jgi:hypothetical protein
MIARIKFNLLSNAALLVAQFRKIKTPVLLSIMTSDSNERTHTAFKLDTDRKANGKNKEGERKIASKRENRQTKLFRYGKRLVGLY